MFEHMEMNDSGMVEQVSRTIDSLFENPPLLKTEDPEKYKQWVESFARTIQPTDLMECVLLKDYVELEWDVVRYRRMRTALIEGTAREAFKSLLRSVLNRGDHTEEELEKHAASVARDLENNLRGELLSADLSSWCWASPPISSSPRPLSCAARNWRLWIKCWRVPKSAATPLCRRSKNVEHKWGGACAKPRKEYWRRKRSLHNKCIELIVATYPSLAHVQTTQ
jgi:hypothetical protein